MKLIFLFFAMVSMKFAYPMTAHLSQEVALRVLPVLNDTLHDMKSSEEVQDASLKEQFLDSALSHCMWLEKYCAKHALDCYVTHYCAYILYNKSRLIRGKENKIVFLTLAQSKCEQVLQETYTLEESTSEDVKEAYGKDQRERFSEAYHYLSLICIAQRELVTQGKDRDFFDQACLAWALKACEVDPHNAARQFEVGSLLYNRYTATKDKNLDKALQYLRQAQAYFEVAAKAQDARAQNSCGAMLLILSDHETTSSERERLLGDSLSWFIKAAQKNYSGALENAQRITATLKALKESKKKPYNEA